MGTVGHLSLPHFLISETVSPHCSWQYFTNDCEIPCNRGIINSKATQNNINVKKLPIFVLYSIDSPAQNFMNNLVQRYKQFEIHPHLPNAH